MDKFEEELQNLTSNELYEKGMAYFYGRDDVRKDYEKALRYFIKAVDFRNARAMEQIGYMYNLGCGVSEDKSEALKWYRRAAEIGDVNLENHFAYCLEDGYGIEQNIDEAIYWFRRSAELGNKKAMFELAALLFEYKGNETEAMNWLVNYNDGNELGAQACLAGIYSSCLKDKKKAFVATIYWVKCIYKVKAQKRMFMRQ